MIEELIPYLMGAQVVVEEFYGSPHPIPKLLSCPMSTFGNKTIAARIISESRWTHDQYCMMRQNHERCDESGTGHLRIFALKGGHIAGLG